MKRLGETSRYLLAEISASFYAAWAFQVAITGLAESARFSGTRHCGTGLEGCSRWL